MKNCGCWLLFWNWDMKSKMPEIRWSDLLKLYPPICCPVETSPSSLQSLSPFTSIATYNRRSESIICNLWIWGETFVQYTYAYFRSENILPSPSGVKNLLSHRSDSLIIMREVNGWNLSRIRKNGSRECILMAYVREALTAFIYLRLDLRPTKRGNKVRGSRSAR